MGRRTLISLAGVTEFIHVFAYVMMAGALVGGILLFAELLTGNVSGTEKAFLVKMVIGMMAYVLELIIITYGGQELFGGDCPIRVFEFCLLGLAGEEIAYHDRCHTMNRLVAKGAPGQVYRRLLWQSGAFFAAAVIALIAPQIVLVFI